MRLRGKIILVTGAASGIGRATADLCEREDARVIRVDRAEADVADETQVRRIFDPLERLDGLVNSAGIAIRKPAHEQDAESWDEIMRVNVGGTFLCSKHAIPKMMVHGGSIVNLSSVVGITGVRNRAAYSTTKGAIVALTRNMALDYAQHRIRVNCLCPGFTRTPLTEALFSDPERVAKLRALHPLGRLGEPEDVARAAVFLLSEDASWITGVALPVDGGFSAGHALDI